MNFGTQLECVVTSTPGEACGINRAITLRGKLWKKPWWRHLHPSHISVTNRPWIMTRGHGQHHWLGSCLTKNSAMAKCRYADTAWKRPCAWVFSLQRAAKKQNIKSHNPFRCERWVQTLCENCKGKPRTQIMKGSWKKQEAATMVDQWDWENLDKKQTNKKVPKGGTQPNPDPTLRAAMDTQTEQFKQRERQKKLSGKAAVKNSVLKQCWHCS